MDENEIKVIESYKRNEEAISGNHISYAILTVATQLSRIANVLEKAWGYCESEIKKGEKEND